jgi:hypothetical protein
MFTGEVAKQGRSASVRKINKSWTLETVGLPEAKEAARRPTLCPGWGFLDNALKERYSTALTPFVATERRTTAAQLVRRAAAPALDPRQPQNRQLRRAMEPQRD